MFEKKDWVIMYWLESPTVHRDLASTIIKTIIKDLVQWANFPVEFPRNSQKLRARE